MGTERTLIFIKPMPNGTLLTASETNKWAQILAMLLGLGRGLYVLESFLSKLDAATLRCIYPDPPNTVWQATLVHLCDTEVPVFILAGEDAIAKMSAHIGTDPDPNKCSAISVRRLMTELVSNHSPNIEVLKNGLPLGDGRKYYFNCIHVIRSGEEFARQFAALQKARVLRT